jgi:glutamate-1-semialdehyde 2,1-aminomutase
VADSPVRTRSTLLRERALRSIPGGVNSNVRLTAPPIFFDRAMGPRMWDVDGNEYVDYVLGQGPCFLGHAHPGVGEAVAAACARGMVYGAQHELEVEAVERLLAAVGWAEQGRLGATGTECVQAALRVARAATGRTHFVHFEGHYHGWLDNVLMNVGDGRAVPASDGQLASSLDESYVLPWNDAAALEQLLTSSGDTVAAVIMEPVMVNAGSIEPRAGYLERVRELCDTYGVVLIFDEVITGFRLARGGAAARYGVTPDLATYGKAMAGGWPVGALLGRADLLEPLGTGRVNHSGTFNAAVMSAAAVVATQQALDEAPPYDFIEAYGADLMRGLAKIGEARGLDLHVQGVPSAFHVSFGPPDPVHDLRELQQLELSRYAAFADQLAAHGLWVAGRGVWYVSAAHGQSELDDTLQRFDEAVEATQP